MTRRVALLVVVCGFAPPIWAEGASFPQALQDKALAATLRLYIPSTKGQASAVRVHRHQNGRTWYLTAAHSLKGLAASDKVQLEWFTPESQGQPARTIKNVFIAMRWENEDLALLTADGDPDGAVLPIVAKGKIPRPDDVAVLTVGCSGGNPPSIVIDRIIAAPLAHKPDGTKARYWKAERKPEVGRSGGPCVSKDGEVIGICSGTHEGSGFYVHADEILGNLGKSPFRDMFGLK